MAYLDIYWPEVAIGLALMVAGGLVGYLIGNAHKTKYKRDDKGKFVRQRCP
jgi:hypothetical protein